MSKTSLQRRYITPENPVRFIDAFVGELDLSKAGFSNAVLNETGRPPYDPGDLLRLYLYGYLNRVRSSRGLDDCAGIINLRTLTADSSYAVEGLAFSTTPVDIFPSRTASSADTVTISSGGYARRIVMTTTGDVRILP